MSEPLEISLAGLALSGTADICVLANVSEPPPVDPDAIGSSIQQIKTVGMGFEGMPLFDVDEWLSGISTADGHNYFATSVEGSVHISSETGWVNLPTDAAAGLSSIYALGPSEAVAVGFRGEIISIARGEYLHVMPPTGQQLNAVHGFGRSSIYAVGNEGQIVRFDGLRWERVPPMTNLNLLSVHCVGPDSVYVGGADGVALHWDGIEWASLSGATKSITTFARFQGAIYAAAGEDGVLRLEGTTFAEFKKLYIYRLLETGQRLFGVGNDLICWFDGEHWVGGRFDQK